MDVDIQDSLNSVIDPELRDATTPQASDTHHSPSLPPADANVNVNPTSPAPSPHLTKSGRPSKVRPIVPGSTADFRRREANRLAAERSRSRQHDKSAALDNAAKVLSEENARLREQIAQLEGGSPNAVAVTAPIAEEGHEEDDQHPSHEDAVAGSANGDSHSRGIREETPIQTQEQQEAHSHTILAALTDITGVDFSEGNEASWMQGMENFLKDSDVSGRLGELAAVATGHEDGGSNPNAPEGHDESERGREGEQSAVAAAAAVVQQAEGPLQVSETKKPRMMSTTSNAAAVLAAAINTEMERIIMEDLAVTKAAIVTVEKQLAKIRAGESPDEVIKEEDVTTVLPSLAALSSDVEVLESATTEAQTGIAEVEGRLPAIHDELAKLREEKLSEEVKVIDLVKEIRELGIEGGDEEKEKLVATLKSIGGFVESLLTEEQGQTENHYVSGAYSSPAIARRRRGRPPKGDISRTFYQSYLLSPASVSASRTESSSSDAEPKPKGRPVRRPRKSRLSHAVHLPDADQADAQERQFQAATELDNGQGDEENSQSRILVEATPTQEEHASAETTADAVNRAEAFILSQLASQQADDHSRDEDMPLDSTSFADFLPAQEELERQAEQEQASGEGQSHQQQQQGQNFLEHGQHQNQQSNEANAYQDPRYVPITPSVLSRLKQGPPGSCDICMRTETTVWRKLVLGGEDHKVCNACGLYHAKFGVIRPPELWGDGKSVKKRRSTARPSLATAADGEGTDGAEGGVGGPRKRAKKGSAGKKGLIIPLSESDESRRAELDAALLGGLVQESEAEANAGHEQDAVVDLGESQDHHMDEGGVTGIQEGAESSEAAMASVFGVEV
ncbi:hypothetical protein CI109_104073 [Kwoniella shandongensis]|uniref:GATA-type domain-containing protein n=1 Tax=Kwoniella shandongensis TaxID=1734106 RepID=A0AAJ8LLY1_9TREE